MNSHGLSRPAIGIVAIVLSFSTFALAGPPLICHPLEIGPAKTLPWVDLNYQKGSGSYDLRNLTRDTLAILDASPSVLARMETLRRATIYARQDPSAAKELITRLQQRTVKPDAGKPDSLAWFDFGYLAEAYRQWMRNGEPNPAIGIDGYASVNKAISLGGSDPEMEFAAALITLNGPEGEHKDHLQKAIAGANADPLLAQNLKSNFNHETIAALLSRSTTAGLK